MLRKLAEVQEVTPAGFQALLANLKPSSFNRYRALIVAICNLSRIPFELPKKAVTEQRIRFLTEDEWKRLYEAIPPHLQPILTFALKTGMRRSNVLNLEWNQVDIPRKHLWIHADTAKGRKTFGIPLADAAVEVLIGQLGKHNAYVFPHTVYKEAGIPKTGPIGSIKTAFLNACVKAGLGTYRKWKDADGKQHKEYSGIRFHDLRHTFASWHLMSGTSMEALKELGAWSDLQMVLRYGHLDKEHLRAQANNAKPWNPGTSVT